MGRRATVRKTFRLTEAQADFLKKKKDEIRKLLPPERAKAATEEGLIQGLLDFWMAFEVRKTGSFPHKDTDSTESPRATESADSPSGGATRRAKGRTSRR